MNEMCKTVVRGKVAEILSIKRRQTERRMVWGRVGGSLGCQKIGCGFGKLCKDHLCGICVLLKKWIDWGWVMLAGEWWATRVTWKWVV